MIIWNGTDLTVLFIAAIILLICGIVLVINRIVHALKKRLKKCTYKARAKEDEE